MLNLLYYYIHAKYMQESCTSFDLCTLLWLCTGNLCTVYSYYIVRVCTRTASHSYYMVRCVLVLHRGAACTSTASHSYYMVRCVLVLHRGAACTSTASHSYYMVRCVLVLHRGAVCTSTASRCGVY
eukprot:Lankesteria_metandrocarpae@DN3577_c0_g1_i3.p1